MHIKSIRAKNFRLIKDVRLNLSDDNQDISLLIGRNNSGKTSFIVLLEKFLSSASPDFCFDDYPVSLRNEVLNFNEESNPQDTAISLLLDIYYGDKDYLGNISDFILDLDPSLYRVQILFECTIIKKKFIEAIASISERKEEYIKKHISDFLITNIYAISNDDEYEQGERNTFVKKEFKSVKKLINIQVIHAKRDVASSESHQKEKKVLSGITTEYFNKTNALSHSDKNGINESIINMDAQLDGEYEKYFSGFLKTAKDFLNIQDLKVISDLQSKGILENHSKVVYGDIKEQLPEHLNGLGYMNILYLILQIEIKKSVFQTDKKDINLLFIEEPEAHTHPQMQYVFIEKIRNLLSGVPSLQTMITSHSSHIVNKCDFKSIRYFLRSVDGSSIDIKNFYTDLHEIYSSENEHDDIDEKANFKFLNQYLTLNSSELFFSEKIIFIEGLTERLLLPLFIKKIDADNRHDPSYIPLTSQNISILEVGANARAFKHFIKFLKIKTLIITDIDTIDDSRSAVAVNLGVDTSNYSLKYYCNAPDKNDKKYKGNNNYDADLSVWLNNVKKRTLGSVNDLIRVSYQATDGGYQGRSFEDAFIAINFDQIKKQKDNIEGLQNKSDLDLASPNFFTLTDRVLKEKSEFASSLLWLALSQDIEWNVPSYIREGLLWIAAK